MKVKCLVNCNGLGYEKFEPGEEREVSEEVGEKLERFGYVEKIEEKKKTDKK